MTNATYSKLFLTKISKYVLLQIFAKICKRTFEEYLLSEFILFMLL